MRRRWLLVPGLLAMTFGGCSAAAHTSSGGTTSRPITQGTGPHSVTGVAPRIEPKTMKLTDKAKKFEMTVVVTNTTPKAEAVWCIGGTDEGSALSITTGLMQAVEVTPSLEPGASTSFTATIREMGTGRPKRASVLCATSRKADAHAPTTAWVYIPVAGTTTVSKKDSMSAWYDQYGVEEFPIIATDTDKIARALASYTAGQPVGPVISDCKSLQSDSEYELTYDSRANPPPPIPNNAFQARWKSALSQLHSYAGSCVSLLRTYETTGTVTVSAEKSAGRKLDAALSAYEKVTRTVETEAGS